MVSSLSSIMPRSVLFWQCVDEWLARCSVLRQGRCCSGIKQLSKTLWRTRHHVKMDCSWNGSRSSVSCSVKISQELSNTYMHMKVRTRVSVCLANLKHQRRHQNCLHYTRPDYQSVGQNMPIWRCVWFRVEWTCLLGSFVQWFYYQFSQSFTGVFQNR